MAAHKYADEVKVILDQNQGKVAAFIAESLMSCAGTAGLTQFSFDT